jgi:hypothetical protein
MKTAKPLRFDVFNWFIRLIKASEMLAANSQDQGEPDANNSSFSHGIAACNAADLRVQLPVPVGSAGV